MAGAATGSTAGGGARSIATEDTGSDARADAAGDGRRHRRPHRRVSIDTVARRPALERCLNTRVAGLARAPTRVRTLTRAWHVSSGGRDRAGTSPACGQAGVAIARVVSRIAVDIAE